jgi:hypothetical protein
MWMNPNEFGKRLGIGVRVAGRIARQRARQADQPTASPPVPPDDTQSSEARVPSPGIVIPPRYAANARDFQQRTHKLTRAAGRGVGGFLRPFSRVGGILWLEVTGFFFGLFALYFATDLWRTRVSYLAGPQHQRFLIAAAMTAVFGYLSISAFWRARRK